MENTAFGSSEAASMGGNARAKALSVEQRREIAEVLHCHAGTRGVNSAYFGQLPSAAKNWGH